MDLSKVGNFEYFYFVCGEKMGLLGNGIFAWVRSTLFWNNLSIYIYQIPFLFSVSKTLQKCFPNLSVPPSFLVITSRPSHVLADRGVP